MPSTIPAARASLFATLDALTVPDGPLEDVAVIRTGQWTEIPEYDRVIVGHAFEINREWGPMGQKRLDESYVIHVLIDTYQAGDDLDAVEARMWELVTVVEGAVIANHKLDDTVRWCRPAGAPDGEDSGPTDQDGVAARITLHLRCEARVDLSTT